MGDNSYMRYVGRARVPLPSLLPTSEALRAAVIHQAAGAALAPQPTTGIARGIYRFATHEAMNLHSDEALARAMALNARLRRVGGR